MCMASPVQQSLFPKFSTQHGGELAKGKRKTARPLATKRAMHVVLRARCSCLHRNAGAILSLRQKLAKKNFIKVYEYSNNSNHLHILIRGKTRLGLQNF